MMKIGLIGALGLLALKLSVPACGTELVSANKEGTDGGILPSSVQSISGDGRYVVFVSRAPDLVRQLGFPGTLNVFVHDLLLHTNRLVSVNRLNNAAGSGDSHDAVISRNGRFVAFVSAAEDLVFDDHNGQEDVFVRDLVLGTTKIVSINKLGASGGNAASGSPSISANGRFIAFASDASDLVTYPFDNNLTTDVFVRDTQLETNALVSVSRLGNSSANGRSIRPVISQDGTKVAFTSWGTDLTFTADGNNASDVFLRNLTAGSTSHISVNRLGTAAGNGGSDNPVLDFTGATVVFSSVANDLVFFDNNNASDVFVRKVAANQTIVMSINRLGVSTGNGASYGGVIDDAGGVVAFQSAASDLVFSDNNNATDIFVRRLSANSNTLVSVNYLGNTSGDGASTRPVLSANGQVVAFQSLAEDLLTSDGNHGSDVYLRRLSSPTNQPVSLNRQGTTTGFGASLNPVMNTNGLVVAFDSYARDLALISPAVIPQVYAFSSPASGLGDFASVLTIQAQAASVILSWSTSLDGFRLESRSATDSDGWSAVTGMPVIRDGSFVLTNRPAGARLYRLAKP